jgi:hypothetical protein
LYEYSTLSSDNKYLAIRNSFCSIGGKQRSAPSTPVVNTIIPSIEIVWNRREEQRQKRLAVVVESTSAGARRQLKLLIFWLIVCLHSNELAAQPMRSLSFGIQHFPEMVLAFFRTSMSLGYCHPIFFMPIIKEVFEP